MDGIAKVYEDFEIHEEWAQDEAHNTLIVPLPGFRKENLRIQVTSSRNTRVLGERPVGLGNKWQRFKKEFPIPSYCDANEISANFESGILYVKHPKTIAPVAVDAKDKPPKTPTDAAPNKAPKASVESKEKKKPQKPPTTTQAAAPKAPKASVESEEKEKPHKPPTTTQTPPKAYKEAPKTPTTEAHDKPPKEGPKTPIMESTMPQKSTFDQPESQRTTNANNYQEEQKRSSSNGTSSQTDVISTNYVSWKRDREKLLDAEQDKVNKNATSHHHDGTETHKKPEYYDRAKKAVADAITKEEYKAAIFGGETKNGGKSGDACSYRPQHGYNYKQVIGGLVMELKEQPRKLVNLGLAVLFVLVIGLYIKKAITSIHEFKREEL